MFVDAIVIAGDRSRANVYPFADFRVAKIREVVGLGTLAQFHLLGLDKVSNVGALADIAARTQPREWTDGSALADP